MLGASGRQRCWQSSVAGVRNQSQHLELSASDATVVRWRFDQLVCRYASSAFWLNFVIEARRV